MKQKNSKTVKSEEENHNAIDWHDIRGLPITKAYFPQIIREFCDGIDEDTMTYGRCYD